MSINLKKIINKSCIFQYESDFEIWGKFYAGCTSQNKEIL